MSGLVRATFFRNGEIAAQTFNDNPAACFEEATFVERGPDDNFLGPIDC